MSAAPSHRPARVGRAHDAPAPCRDHPWPQVRGELVVAPARCSPPWPGRSGWRHRRGTGRRRCRRARPARVNACKDRQQPLCRITCLWTTNSWNGRNCQSWKYQPRFLRDVECGSCFGVCQDDNHSAGIPGQLKGYHYKRRNTDRVNKSKTLMIAKSAHLM